MKVFTAAEPTTVLATKRSTPSMRSTRAGLLQTKLTVGPVSDSFEQEADRTAHSVMNRPTHSSGLPLALNITSIAQRSPKSKRDGDDDEKRVQKLAAASAPETALEIFGVPKAVETQIASMKSGGTPLPTTERAFFESRFGYRFGDVRLHTGSDAGAVAAALHARAFTVGQHIFLGHGEYQPGSAVGRHLLAHELTHTIQQSSTSHRAARLVQRSVRDLIPNSILKTLRDWAAKAPSYNLLAGFMHQDPITGAPVQVSREELVHQSLAIFSDQGKAIFQELQADQSITRILSFFDQQLAQLNVSLDLVLNLIQQAWDELGSLEALSPGNVWAKITAKFDPVYTRVKNFVINVGKFIFETLKEKVLKWLKNWGASIPGYHVLAFILGKDPITSEPVPRTPVNFVRAVLSLVPGGDQIFENLQKSRTIERTVEWLNREIVKLDLSWEQLQALFHKAWDVISVADVLHPLVFVDKIRDIFEKPAMRVKNFALAVGKKVFEIIFEGVIFLAGPLGRQVAGIFQKASESFSKIVADPVAFLRHLIDAVMLGFKQFSVKILEHLEAGVVAWLTGALQGAGLVLPKVWDTKGIVSVVLQVLGITYAKMRTKLVKVLGEETVGRIEKTWDFLMTLVTDGPAAAWARISESLGNVWTLIIGGIKNWAIGKIIKAAILKLVAMFSPVGALIQSIIETYKTVEFFVQRIQQIVALVEAIVNSIANIAAGQIAAAANYVERTLARTIPLIIGFLANLIGLGNISEGIRSTITAIQERVDKALDAAIAWMVKQAQKLFGKSVAPHDEKWAAGVAGVKADIATMKDVTPEALAQASPGWKNKYGFSELRAQVGQDGANWEMVGAMSPEEAFLKGNRYSPVLAKNTKYIFYGQHIGLSGSDQHDYPGVGEHKSTAWVKTDCIITYVSPSNKEWRVKAFNSDHSLALEPYVNKPVILDSQMSAGNGALKVSTVRAEYLTHSEYLEPQTVPYAWYRYVPAVRNSLVKGHLVNGKTGAHGVYGNLVPMTRSHNSIYEKIFEKDVKTPLKNYGGHYWMHVNVVYFSNNHPSISNYSDFVERLEVSYEKMLPKAGNSWRAVLPGTVGRFQLHAPSRYEVM